jgi:hypothetical protein
MGKIGLYLTKPACDFVRDEATRLGMSESEFVAETFYRIYPQWRPSSPITSPSSTEDTPAELHRLLLELQTFPGYLDAWQELRWCTGKPTAYGTYVAWISSQKKFIKRAGRPGGNQLLLHAVRHLISSLGDSGATEQSVIEAAKNARAKFSYSDTHERKNHNG